MNSNQLDKLHEFDFWSMIRGLEWGDKTTQCITAKRNIMKNFPPYKVNAFRRIANNYAEKLVNIYESLSKSVFSYTELYNGAMEVVGFGKSELERYMKEPLLLAGVVEAVINKEEDEKFAYALPLEDDYYDEDVIV
jgi:hypothetical protein